MKIKDADPSIKNIKQLKVQVDTTQKNKQTQTINKN